MNAKDTLKLISKQWCNVHDMENLLDLQKADLLKL